MATTHLIAPACARTCTKWPTMTKWHGSTWSTSKAKAAHDDEVRGHKTAEPFFLTWQVWKQHPPSSVALFHPLWPYWLQCDGTRLAASCFIQTPGAAVCVCVIITAEVVHVFLMMNQWSSKTNFLRLFALLPLGPDSFLLFRHVQMQTEQ